MYEKHGIVEDGQKIHHLPHYCNAEHADVVHLFFEYACKNWQQLCVVMKKEFHEADPEQHHNNQAFLEKLKTAGCKDMGAVKGYCCQFNVILNKLVAEKTLDSFTQALWFLHGLPEDLC